jgi:orotidine-5'-phosphate decarboxylase
LGLGEFRERMLRSAQEHRSRVVLALDFDGEYERRLEAATALLGVVGERVAAVKVNHHLLLPFGLRGTAGIVKQCREVGIPVVADLKLNDIGATNINAVDSLVDFGYDAVIANPFVGREEGLGEAIDRMHSRGGGVLLLVYMSHRGAEEGYALKVEGGDPIYRIFAARARSWKADGVIVSAKDPGKISETRRIVGDESLIVSPGVGTQGGEAKSAFSAGADFVIVGRSVIMSPDPTRSLAEIGGI